MSSAQIIANVLHDEAAEARQRREAGMQSAVDEIKNLVDQKRHVERLNTVEAAQFAADEKRINQLENRLMNLNVAEADELVSLRQKRESGAMAGGRNTRDIDTRLSAIQRQHPALYAQVVAENGRASK